MVGASPFGVAATGEADTAAGRPGRRAAEWLAAAAARASTPKRPPPTPPYLVERLANEVEVELLQAQLAQVRAQRDGFAQGLARLSGRAYARELLVRCLVSWCAFRDGRGRWA